MLLGSKNIAVGDTRRYKVDYADFLHFGETLTSVTVTVIQPMATGALVGRNSAAIVGTAGTTPFFDAKEMALYFWVTAGVLDETFTVQVTAITSINETINDTMNFTVVTP